MVCVGQRVGTGCGSGQSSQYTEVHGPANPSCNNAQREITVILVVAVKEASELVAVDRVVGGVEVQDDPLGRPGVGLEEQGNEEPLDVVGAARDLLVATVLIGTDGGQFQA